MPASPTRPTPKVTPELVQFRSQIDAIDDELIRLLKTRSDIVVKVGAHKRNWLKHPCFARPGREAEIVRRMWREFQGSPFSAHAAAQIWRLVIAASTQIESKLRLSVCASETDPTLFWLAREYFGAFSPIHLQPNGNRVVGDVVDGKAEIGILPSFESQTQGGWWQTLAGQGNHAPKIFAHIPFVVTDAHFNHTSFAIAQLDPEPTGDDVTLLAVETTDMSVNRLNAAFANAGLSTSRVQFASTTAGTVNHLLRVEDFIEAGDPRLDKVQELLHESSVHCKVLGSYAIPIDARKA